MCVLVAAMFLVADAAAHAALVSEWTFDASGTTNAITGVTGSVAGTASVGTGGKIGPGALLLPDANGSSFDPTSANLPSPEAYGSNNNGLWSGSCSFWAKIDSTGSSQARPTFMSNHWASGQMTFFMGASNKLSFIAQPTSQSTSVLENCGLGYDQGDDIGTSIWGDHTWHHFAYTWNLTTGTPGTGSLAIYFDGNPLTVTLLNNSLSSSDVYPAEDFARIGSDCDGYHGFGGAMDDVAVFNTQLTTAQVKAIMNMGNSNWNYIARGLQGLFDLYTGTSSADAYYMASLGWSKYGRGIAFDGSGDFVTGGLTWTGIGDSTWSTAPAAFGLKNWIGRGPYVEFGASGGVRLLGAYPADYFDGSAVTFDDGATRTVADISAADVTPSSVTFYNTSKNFTITGTKGIAGVSTTVRKNGTGTVTMSSINTYGGKTTVEAGALVLQGRNKAMHPVLDLGGTDIKAGMLVLDYAGETSPAATVKSLITTSYNAAGGTHFNTGKFQSSTADATYGLGWIENTGDQKITVAHTIYGDADLNGSVGLADLGSVLTNWGVGTNWSEGDSNYSGSVDLADLGTVLTNWGLSVGSLTPTADTQTVPEPSNMLLVAAAMAFVAWTIRRRLPWPVVRSA